MFKQIAVGVDEHEGGCDAAALAKRLLAPDGELTLAYVYAGDSHIYRNTSPAYEASEHERARELLSRRRARKPASKRICAGADPRLRAGACTSCAK
jgi:hypothetical protein